MINLRRVTGLSALLDEADAFLVDQFGTLHDGAAVYPGALDALLALRAAGKRVLLLSNSGKRAAANVARLSAIGIAPDCYDGFLSSGEVAWQLLARNPPPPLCGARTCLLLARDGDDGPLEGLGLRPVDRAEDADLVLIAGSEAERRPLSDYQNLLEPAAARGLPCLCTNPDRTMLVAGRMAPGAGRIAELYEALGGSVIRIGKPFPAMYEAAFRLLGNVPRARVFGVGDSVEHDIAGAQEARCRSALVTAGILAGARDRDIAAEITRFGALPDFVLQSFTL